MIVDTALLKILQPIAEKMGNKYLDSKDDWAAGLRSDEFSHQLNMLIKGNYIGLLEGLVSELSFYQEFTVKHPDWTITAPNLSVNAYGVKGIDFTISKGSIIKTIDVKTGSLLVRSDKVDNCDIYVFCSYFLNAGNSHIIGCINKENVKLATMGYNKHKRLNYQITREMLRRL